jgi:hypothetical protein
MPIRIECAAPGLEANWLDVADKWTQRDVERLVEATDEAFYELMRAKVVACNIELETGEAITDPAHITSGRMMDADVVLLGWVGRALPLAVAQRRLLGNASARLSSNANGRTMTTTIAAPNPTPTN